MQNRIEQSESINPNELPLELGANLLIGSFGLSQGMSSLQPYIFHYLHLRFSGWKIHEEQIPQIVQLATPCTKEIVYGARNNPKENARPYSQHVLVDYFDRIINDEIIKQNLESELRVMKHVLAGKEEVYFSTWRRIVIRSDIDLLKTVDETVLKIADLMKERDDHYMAEGRAVRYFDEYVAGKSTGNAIYDGMIERIKKLTLIT